MTNRPPQTNPYVATDILIEHYDGKKDGLVLITRKNPPYGIAIPGGFAELGLSLPQNAVKEALEETSLEVILENPRSAPPSLREAERARNTLDEYGGCPFLFSALTPEDKIEPNPFLIRSDPSRDVRAQIISVAYLGRGYGRLMANDDAKTAGLYSLGELVDLLGKKKFAFDHESIIKCYLNYRGQFGPIAKRDAWSG